MPSYRLQQTIGFTLFRTSMRLKAEFAKELSAFDITTEQFAVLALLWEKDNLFQHEIAALLFKDRPNITRILEKLERKNLINRSPDDEDRRATRVRLTRGGRDIEDPVTAAALSFRSRAYRGLSDVEMRRLSELLGKILENL